MIQARAVPQYFVINPYHYTPTPAICLVYTIVFALSAVAHIVQGWKARHWVVFPTLATGAALEAIGWACRFWSTKNILKSTPFVIQLTLLVFAPVFFSSYLYVALKKIITALGSEYALLKPRLYLLFFLVADVGSLVIQCGGAAWAATSTPAPKAATNVIIVGLVIQLVAMFVFIILAIDYSLRIKNQRPYAFQLKHLGRQGGSYGLQDKAQEPSTPDNVNFLPSAEIGVTGWTSLDRAQRKGWWLYLLAMAICSAAVVARGLFRLVEFTEGWDGKLNSFEVYPTVFDGGLMIIATLCFNILNPLWLLPRHQSWKDKSW